MDWHETYRQRVVTPEQAAVMIRPGSRIYISGNAAAPYVLLDAVAARSPSLKGVEVVHVLLLGNDPLSGQSSLGTFRHNSLFVGPADREMVNEGRADYTPIHLHAIPRLFAESILPLDAAVIQTAPPDEHGFMSLGVECMATAAAINHSPLIVAQVNQRMPRTLGDCFIHVSRIAALVEVSTPLPELERAVFGERERRIAQFIAGLVEDGSTIQLGIGAIPDAVLSCVRDRRDLGIHTEMISDGIMEGVEAGVITGSRKTIHRGKVIGTFALGSNRLYSYLDNNPMFEFHPVEYTNDPFVIAQNDRMVSINSAIEVDITGQVCSDSIGSHIYSGFGGQVDFVRGAAHSKGGKSIIALPSTALGGTVSRIVPTLREGAGVVTTRADVHYVITEYGVASMMGRNLRERARSLIEIAHPDFREFLTRAAYERKLSSTQVPSIPLK
jgi:acyl-CoA hydrolase